MTCRLARFDRRLAARHGAARLAGCDEAGRGCLAGPVVVAAVILPPGLDLDGVRDSKTLRPAARERAFAAVTSAALGWAALCVAPSEVDRRNVLGASLWGMTRALSRLRPRADLVLVDGRDLPPDLPLPAVAVVGGDGRSLAVAAASVVAKVLRDRVMRSWDRRHPGYGFAVNLGYPTAEHRLALESRGPCPLHRRSFRPVAQRIHQRTLPFS